MIEEQVEIVVSVQPAEAFRFVSDPRNELAWNRYAVRIEKTSAGPNRKGSRHRGNYRGAGTFDLEVTQYVPNVRSGCSGRSRWLGWDQTDELQALDGSVQVRRSMVGYFKGPMRLLEPVLAGPFKRRFRDSAALIKEALESGRAAQLLNELRRQDVENA
jgi:hypothetical protein